MVDDGRVSSIDKRRGASLAEDHLNCGGKSVNFFASFFGSVVHWY